MSDVPMLKLGLSMMSSYCVVCNADRLHVEAESGWYCYQCEKPVTPQMATESLRVRLREACVPLANVRWTGTAIRVQVFRSAAEVPSEHLGFPVDVMRVGGSTHWPERKAERGET